MSTTLETLKAERVTCLKSGNKTRSAVISLILSAIKQVEVDTRKELSEDEVIGVLTKMVKQRNDSITQYDAAGRVDLADVERFETVIIEEYLPAPVSEEEIDLLIQKTILETEAAGMKDMGRVVAVLKPVLIGKADMGLVSRKVKELLTA